LNDTLKEKGLLCQNNQPLGVKKQTSSSIQAKTAKEARK